MPFALRFTVYIVGGGALLAWLNPSRGALEIVAVLALIGVLAGVDTVLMGREGAAPRRGRKAGAAPAEPGSGPRKGWARRGGQGDSAGESRSERKGLHVVYSSGSLEQAQTLALLLRERGLHPMLATQRGTGPGEALQVEVHVPAAEWRKALPIASKFTTRRAES